MQTLEAIKAEVSREWRRGAHARREVGFKDFVKRYRTDLFSDVYDKAQRTKERRAKNKYYRDKSREHKRIREERAAYKLMNQDISAARDRWAND